MFFSKSGLKVFHSPETLKTDLFGCSLQAVLTKEGAFIAKSPAKRDEAIDGLL